MLNSIPFQCLERSEQLGQSITKETWFITTESGNLIRRTVYKEHNGSVVAFRDCGTGVDKRLFVENMFYELNYGKDPWLQIQCDSHVYSANQVKFFDVR